MSVCQHCNKRNATFGGNAPACMYCYNNGHKNLPPLSFCPKCAKKPIKPGGGEPMPINQNNELKKAA